MRKGKRKGKGGEEEEDNKYVVVDSVYVYLRTHRESKYR
jgi:hypothetical protein